MSKKRQNEVKRIKFLFHVVKNIAGQVLMYNSNNIHRLKKKSRHRIDSNWIWDEKHFKKIDPKNRKKSIKINAKMQM